MAYVVASVLVIAFLCFYQYWYAFVAIGALVLIVSICREIYIDTHPYAGKPQTFRIKNRKGNTVVSCTGENMGEAFEATFKRLERTALSSTNIRVIGEYVGYMTSLYNQVKNKYPKYDFSEFEERCAQARVRYEQLLASRNSSYFLDAESKQYERSLLTPRLRYEILKRDGYRCKICGRTAKDDHVKLEVDHIKPIAKGGKTTRENLQTLCAECNRGKSADYDAPQDNDWIQ